MPAQLSRNIVVPILIPDALENNSQNAVLFSENNMQGDLFKAR